MHILREPGRRSRKSMCFPGGHTVTSPRGEKESTNRSVVFENRVTANIMSLIARGTYEDRQIRCVCERTCNNGWMRKAVEDRARPILLPLIKGDLVRITPAQQELIATWATMKAMVAEWTICGNVTTNHMQRKRMMWRQLPPERNWGVWIGRFLTDTGKPEANGITPNGNHIPFFFWAIR